MANLLTVNVGGFFWLECEVDAKLEGPKPENNQSDSKVTPGSWPQSGSKMTKTSLGQNYYKKTSLQK